jgi:uncharacterized protein YvpB
MIKRVIMIVMISVFLPATELIANERLFMIDGVKPVSQFPQLPSGCEITAATMLVNYFGASTTKMDVADLIPKGSMPRLVNHSYVGGNPNQVFVGNPYSTIGYGVFEKPILKIIDHFFPDRSNNLTGQSFDDLLATVRKGTPVVVWVTLNLKEPIKIDEWVDIKQNIVYWNGPEHAMLFVGLDDNDGYFNDPYTGKRVKYNLKTFKDRWEKMGSRAVTLSAPESTIFNDIKHHWALDTILWSNKNKIVQGHQDGSFKPDDTVTEAEFLAMIFRMYPESIKALNINPASNGVWSEIYYIYANEYNLELDGNSPNRSISRSEVAQIISGLSGKNYVNHDDAIQFLLDSGYSQGKTSATVSGYDGNNSLTRAEALQLLKNLQDKGFTVLKARPEPSI